MLGIACAFAGPLCAQQRNDSLLATFGGLEDDSTRLDSMITVAFDLGYSDPMLGLWLSDKAIEEAKAIHKPKMQGDALISLGSVYYNLKIRDLALQNFLKALSLYDSIGSEMGQLAAWNNIGNVQGDQKHYLESIESYRNARRTALKIKSKNAAMVILTNIANIYQEMNQFERALEVCDSAILEIVTGKDARSLYVIHTIQGAVYEKQKDYAQALYYVDLAIKESNEAEDDYNQVTNLLARARIRAFQHMEGEASQDANLALELARSFGSKETVVDCYEVLTQIAKGSGDANLALQWMEKGKALSDSIQTEESEAALANYQALYEVNQKDAKIDLLNKDREIQAANLLNVWYLFGLVSVVLLAMMVIVVVLVRNNKARRRINLELQGKNEQILAQHQKISQQNAALTDQNEQLNNLNHEMSGLLHVVAHDLKAPLNQVTGLLSVVEDEGNLNPTQEKMLGLAKKVTNNAGNLVKDLVELGSAEQQGAHLQKVPVPLTALVAEIAAAFSADAARKSIALKTALPEDEAICQTEPNQLRRILENLISNALKFSPSGKNVQISLTQSAGFYRISIQDQGPGISTADQKNLYRKFHKLSARPTGGESSSGLGLAIVKTLVEQLGGEISLTSEVGVGSTFVVRMPC